jgi:ABC-type uncharacterized transport system permease subunit
MDLFLHGFFWVLLLQASIKIAAPILLAALGECVAEKAGFMNIGIEGMMTVGAWAAFLAALLTGSAWTGLCAGALAAGLIALLAGWICISRRADQIVTGIMLNLFCLGLTGMSFKAIIGARAEPNLAPIANYRIPVLADIPYIGKIFFEHSPVIYLTFALVPIFWIMLNRTVLGLKVRAVGENPETVDAAGINVYGVRYFAIIVGGLMAGLGGGVLSVGQLGVFSEFMIGGRGFIALAVVVFARWDPKKILAAAMLFGVAEAVQARLQALQAPIPHEFLLMLPYLLTIVVLVGMTGKATYPKAIAVPFVKGRRTN